MNSTSTLLAARAVAATMLRSTLVRFFVIMGCLGLLLIVGTGILMNTSSGWWGLLLPLWLLLVGVAGLGLATANYVAKRLNPRKLTREESKMITGFVDDMNEKVIAGQLIKRSPVWLSMLVTFSFLRGGRDAAARTILSPLEEAKDLRSRFTEIMRLFD